MDSKATVQALMDSVQQGDFVKAQSTLSNDFQFSGPVPQPISGPAWMGMSASLKTAFPDLNLPVQDRERGWQYSTYLSPT